MKLISRGPVSSSTPAVPPAAEPAAEPTAAPATVQQTVKPSGLVPIKRRPVSQPSVAVDHEPPTYQPDPHLTADLRAEQRLLDLARAAGVLKAGDRLVIIPAVLQWTEPTIVDKGRDLELVAQLAEQYPQVLGAEVATAVAAAGDPRRCYSDFSAGLPLSAVLVRLGKDLRCPALIGAAEVWGAFVADKLSQDAAANARRTSGGSMVCGCSVGGDSATNSAGQAGAFGHTPWCTSADRESMITDWQAMPSVEDMDYFTEDYRAEHAPE